MVNCLTMGCLFCALAIVIGLISVLQVGAGIYFSSIQPDLIIINALIRTETFIGYPAYILFVFIGLGLSSLLFSFVSIYGTVRRATALSVVLAVLWVRSSFDRNSFFISADSSSSLWSISFCSSPLFSITFSFFLNYDRCSFVLCNDPPCSFRHIWISYNRNIPAVVSISRMITTICHWTLFPRRAVECPIVGETRISISTRT